MDAILYLRKRLNCISLCARIVIVNTAILAIWAGAAALLAVQFEQAGAPIEYKVLGFVAGTALLALINWGFVKTALRPLRQLSALADHLSLQEATIDRRFREENDPDIQQLAQTLHLLVGELEDSNRRYRELSKRAINAQEEERKRIARSLHDDTGQALSTLIINLERLERQGFPEAPEIEARMGAARALAADILNTLRKIISDLRPSILDDLGLVPAIRWYASTYLGSSGVELNLIAPDDNLQVPIELATTLFRVTQEAINNISRHAQARAASITLRKNGDSIYLRIEDDGRGFDVAQDSGQAMERRHWGLLGIQERVELVRGEFMVVSEPGCGTLMEISIPLGKREE
jgi:two-component system sensor histidine kinase UhpB